MSRAPNVARAGSTEWSSGSRESPSIIRQSRLCRASSGPSDRWIASFIVIEEAANHAPEADIPLSIRISSTGEAPGLEPTVAGLADRSEVERADRAQAISGFRRHGNPSAPRRRLNHVPNVLDVPNVLNESATEDVDNGEEDLDTYRWSRAERDHRPCGRGSRAWRRLDGSSPQSVSRSGACARPVRADDRVRRPGDVAADG